MSLNWDKMFRRYVYDEEKTPYFTAVSRLNKRQARYEVFVYALFIGLLFGFTGIAALAGKLPHGNATGVPIYTFFTVWMAIAFAWTRNQMAGSFCALAPIAVAVYLIIYGFPPKLGPNDKLLIGAVLVCWTYYSWRIVRLAAHYPNMPEPEEPPGPFRRNPFDSLK